MVTVLCQLVIGYFGFGDWFVLLMSRASVCRPLVFGFVELVGLGLVCGSWTWLLAAAEVSRMLRQATESCVQGSPARVQGLVIDVVRVKVGGFQGCGKNPWFKR